MKALLAGSELCRNLGDEARSGGVVCRRFEDLDAVFESDTCDNLGQVICAFQPPPGFRCGDNQFEHHKEYSGPLTMKHVGLCAQDGPEEKTGEMRFQISAISARLNATLSVAGVVCTYSGRLSDSYDGTMSCPDREAVPLKLW
jgi:hypothetical protein